MTLIEGTYPNLFDRPGYGSLPQIESAEDLSDEDEIAPWCTSCKHYPTPECEEPCRGCSFTNHEPEEGLVCDTCKHRGKSFKEDPCKSCSGSNHNKE
jgi:hypothetical protein